MKLHDDMKEAQARLDRQFRAALLSLALEGLALAVVLLFVWWLVGLMHPVHKYSNVPGQDHPYCPPDPKECG